MLFRFSLDCLSPPRKESQRYRAQEREGGRGRDIQTLLRYAALSNQYNDYQINTTTSRVPLGESMDTPFDVLDIILNFWIVVQRGPRIEPASTASAD